MSQLLAAQMMANMAAAGVTPNADPGQAAAEKLKNVAQNVGPAVANANYAGAPAQFMSGLDNLAGRYNAGVRRIGDPVRSALLNAITPQPEAPPTVDELRAKQPGLLDFLKNYVNK